MSEGDRSASHGRRVGVATHSAWGNIQGTTDLSYSDSFRDSHGGSLLNLTDDGRTHRDWTPRPGRIKKCDFCEGRSTGIIHQCSKCPILICRECAMNGRWKGDMTHYIDTQALDWEYPANKTANICFTGSQRVRRSRSDSVAPDAGGSEQGSEITNKTNGSGPKRRVHFAKDEDNGNNHEPVPQKRQKKTRSPVLSTSSTLGQVSSSLKTSPGLQPTHGDEKSSGKSPGDLPPSYENHVYPISSSVTKLQQSPSPKELGSHAGPLTAAAGRSSVRASAAMAMHRMSTPGRRFQDNMRDLVEKKDTGTVDSKNQIPTGHSRVQRHRRASSASGSQPPPLETTNKRLKAGPSLPLQRQPPHRGPFPSRKREQQVMGLYYEIFGAEGYRPLFLDITDLPCNVEQDVMAGLAHHEPPLPGMPVRNKNLSQLKTDRASPPEHAVYHKQVQEYMMTGGYFDPTRMLPPRPPNYAEDSFHNYPKGLAYVPTLRTTPIWSPMNDLSPEELRIMHDDRYLKEKTAAAWQSSPIVLRVREFGIQAFNLNNWVGKGAGPGDYEALKLLWEVALVRMGRVVLTAAPQTKKWFFDELKKVFFEEDPEATKSDDNRKDPEATKSDDTGKDPEATKSDEDGRVLIMQESKKQIVNRIPDGNGHINAAKGTGGGGEENEEDMEETESESGDFDDDRDSDYNPSM